MIKKSNVSLNTRVVNVDVQNTLDIHILELDQDSNVQDAIEFLVSEYKLFIDRVGKSDLTVIPTTNNQ